MGGSVRRLVDHLQPALVRQRRRTVILRAAGTLASSDHYAQVTIAATTAVSHGVWCRGDTTLANGYLLAQQRQQLGPLQSRRRQRSPPSAATPQQPQRAMSSKIQVVGSTIKGYINGTLRASVTDTAVTQARASASAHESTEQPPLRRFQRRGCHRPARPSEHRRTETSSAQTLAGAKTAPHRPSPARRPRAPLPSRTRRRPSPGPRPPPSPWPPSSSPRSTAGTKAAALVPAVEQDRPGPHGTVTSVSPPLNACRSRAPRPQP
jgi:hypothetical protein